MNDIRRGEMRIEHSLGGGPVVVSRWAAHYVLFGRGHTIEEAQGQLDRLIELYSPRPVPVPVQEVER